MRSIILCAVLSAAVVALGARAAEQQQQIRFLRPQRSTLEEVFLNAVDRR